MEFSGRDLSQRLWVYEKWGVTCSGRAASTSFMSPVGLTTCCPPGGRTALICLHGERYDARFWVGKRMGSVFPLSFVNFPVGICLSSWVTGNEAGDRSAVIYVETVVTPTGKCMKGKLCCRILTFTAKNSSYHLINRNWWEINKEN